MRPQEMILRCYGYQTSRGTWIVKCIDLDLVDEEDTFDKAKKSLENAIKGYVGAVLDTQDLTTIPKLLKRKSPSKDILSYHIIRFLNKVKAIKSRLVFEEPIPFCLNTNAC